MKDQEELLEQLKNDMANMIDECNTIMHHLDALRRILSTIGKEKVDDSTPEENK